MVENIEENRVEGQEEIDEKLEDYIRLVSRNLSYGDWYLCYNLVKNMDSVTYVEWLQKMTELLRDKEEKLEEDEKRCQETKRRQQSEGFVVFQLRNLLNSD